MLRLSYLYMKNSIKNKTLLLIICVILILAVFVIFQPQRTGTFIWNNFKFADAALFLNHDANLALKIGNYYFNGGTYDLTKAELAFEKSLEFDPGIALGNYQLARIYFIRGNFPKAIDYINQELSLHPEIPNSYYVRGLINGYWGDLKSAEKDFSLFVNLEPQQWAGYNDLAWILAKESKFAEAKKTIAEAFKRMPGIERRNPWLWTSIGVAHLNLEEYNEARKAFITALDLNKKMTPEYFWSAYPGNDPRGAYAAFQQFNAALHLNLALAYENLGENNNAKKEYLAYLALIPSGPYPQKNEIEQRIEKIP